MEVASSGVKVVLVEPGGFKTRIWEDFARDAEGHKGSRFEDAYRRSLQAMKLTQALMGQPQKVAGVIGRALGSPLPRARYLVGYEPPTGKRGWRKIKVDVDRPAVTARARKGYYGEG